MRIIVVAVAIAVVTGPPVAASAAFHPERPPAVAWTPCVADPTAQCAILSVPIDHDRPSAGRTTLAIARRPAADPAARIGALLVNPGGPGLSGVAMALDGSHFSPALRARFDIVGFDPRGVGASRHVACPAVPEPVPPRDQASLDRLRRRNAGLAQACEAADPLAVHLSDYDMARDVEDIRRALGGEPLTWYGTSYGTEIGQAYAELFGRHIRAMVLDAVVDRDRSGAAHLLAASASAEDAFARFTTWCRVTAGCALHGRDAGRVLDRVLARAERRPLLVHGRVVSADEIRTAAYLGLYDPARGWPSLAESLTAAEAAPPADHPAGPATPTDAGVLAAICQDEDFPLARYAQLAGLLSRARTLAPHLQVAAVPYHRLLNCVGRVATDRPHRFDPRTPLPPILLVNGRHDPITPYPGAVAAAHAIPAAVLVTYRGDGHSAYPRSACVRRIVDAYLLSRAQPPRRTSCPASVPESPAPGFPPPQRAPGPV